MSSSLFLLAGLERLFEEEKPSVLVITVRVHKKFLPILRIFDLVTELVESRNSPADQSFTITFNYLLLS